MDLITYIESLEINSNNLLQQVKPCSISQLTFKKNESWSIMEILEHICITDRVVYSLVSRPSTNIHDSEQIIGLERFKNFGSNRERKVPAPGLLQPKGKITDLEQFEHIFITQRNSLKEELLNHTIRVDNRTHKHPLMGEMTITDWLYFMVYHSQRHLGQIKELLSEVSS
jgi:uncharacterized damage-inducible protein DinB